MNEPFFRACALLAGCLQIEAQQEFFCSIQFDPENTYLVKMDNVKFKWVILLFKLFFIRRGICHMKGMICQWTFDD